MMISHHTIITLYKCSIWLFAIKRININYHLFNHLFLVSFLNILKGDVVYFPFTWFLFGCSTSKYLFLICVMGISWYWEVTGISFRPLGATNMMSSKGGEQNTHSTVAFTLWILFSSESPLSLKVNWHDFSIYCYFKFVKRYGVKQNLALQWWMLVYFIKNIFFY